MALLIPSKPCQRGGRQPTGVRLLGIAWGGLLSCVNPAPWPQQAAVKPTIPQAFLGEWNANLSECGTLRSESRLLLEPHQATFFRSKAEVLQLQVENPRRIRLTLGFEHQARGGDAAGESQAIPYNLQRRYLLSSDLKRLQDISQGEQGLMRHRCPSSSR